MAEENETKPKKFALKRKYFRRAEKEKAVVPDESEEGLAALAELVEENFFVSRPRFASVMSLIITIVGLLSFVTIPVAQFPDIVPPSVTVRAFYPGASAETVESTVAQIIESAVNGVADMLYMRSTSASDGSYTLTVTFRLGTNPDLNTVNVQNRVNRVLPILPDAISQTGVSVQSAASAMLMVVAFHSPGQTLDSLFVGNYVLMNIQDSIARIPGVGDTMLFGQKYSLRIWLDVTKMQGLNLAASDVINAVASQNMQASLGRIGSRPNPEGQELQLNIDTRGRLSSVEDFENIVIRVNPADGSFLRIRDIATVELGAERDDISSNFNGAPSAGLMINQGVGSNAVGVAAEIKKRLDELSRLFPQDLEYDIVYDATVFIEASIQEVQVTMLIAFVLVVLIIYLFLGSWRATLVPMISVPVSLIGTFAVLRATGNTLNTISMFALVLAIGVVTDDAIVVVENVERLMRDHKMPARKATVKSMKEITMPIVAIMLVVLSIFVPVAFIPGTTGTLFREFALTISVAIMISVFTALTLSPALCSLLLKPKYSAPRGIPGMITGGIERVRRGYGWALGKIIHVSKLSVIIVLGLGAFLFFLFRVTPTSFLPDEDQGIFLIQTQLPEGASLNRTIAVLSEIEETLKTTRGVRSSMTVIGYNLLGGSVQSNAGALFVALDPYRQRRTPDLSVTAIMGQVMGRVMRNPRVTDAILIPFQFPPIIGLGTVGGFEYQLIDLEGGSITAFHDTMRGLLIQANQQPGLAQVFSLFSVNTPQVFMNVDRDKAIAHGLMISDVFNSMRAVFGSAYVNDFNLFGRPWQVNVQGQMSDRANLENIYSLEVRNAWGKMVPLRSFVTLERVMGPQIVTRYNNYRSISINGQAAPGVSSGTAIGIMERLSENLPPQYSYSWTGTSLEEKEAGGQIVIIFALSIVFAYLFLTALYESWVLPFVILLASCTGLIGSILGTYLMGLNINIYVQIGMLALIAIASKNAILIVEFAKDARDKEGAGIIEAAVQAGKTRFRAIMMTMLSTAAGLIPLLIATGAGAVSRHSVGASLFFGLLFATFVGIFLIPMMYVVAESMRMSFKR
ncbi:MAG: efflux RND transporter permease subunit [Alphaproteobacteria bacterium]|nr:efflux RND transporter permease subunit [Alphaproteobacteria bacterium]